MKIKLRNTVEDNHGQTFKSWLEDGRDGPVLVVEEKTGRTYGKWRWYLSSLLGISEYSSGRRTGDKLYLDMGQDWYVTGMKKLLAEAEKVAEKRGLVLASEKSIAEELLDVAKEMLADDGSSVEEVEEIEPQGSTPVKERKKKAANDPWAAKREIAKRLRAVASRVEDIYISEDSYVFGDFGPSYKRSVNAGMKQLDGLTTKLESAVKKVIDKIEE